ncbi:hypothetical protein [Nonlabens sp.]|uniref:hypothetical protein n=1 Tax=Nonlabens sp. TaxID=1888209 RepID=UPI001BCBAE24|nr:hypothetical protein [Nonlabens sp.]
MKNLKNIIRGVSFVLSLFMVFNTSAQKEEYTEAYVKGQLQQGMASLVESLRPSYEKGMDYDDFLTVLLGENSTYEMPKEGKALLEKSFVYLSEGFSNEGIAKSSSVEEIATAALYVHNYNSKYNSSNDNSILFGLNLKNEKSDSEYGLSTALTKSSSRCRWWQLGCHLRSVFGESGGNTINNAIIEIILRILKGL